jgi:hypothetical protein
MCSKYEGVKGERFITSAPGCRLRREPRDHLLGGGPAGHQPVRAAQPPATEERDGAGGMESESASFRGPELAKLDLSWLVLRALQKYVSITVRPNLVQARYRTLIFVERSSTIERNQDFKKWKRMQTII